MAVAFSPVPERLQRLAAHVWLARWPGETDATLVLKEARPDDPDALDREWQALLQVPSHRLPEALALSGRPGAVDGVLLLRRRAGRTLETPLEPGDPLSALAVAMEATRALAAVHAAGLVHGDLHPGNLLLDERGRVTLLDLGLAGRAGQPAVGTGHPAFAAPGRLAGDAFDPRDDLFSLGLTLWHALGWAPPYRDYPALRPAPQDQPALVDVAASLRPLQRVLAGWLAVARDHRPADVERALRQLTDLQGESRPDEAATLAADLRGAAGRPLAWSPTQVLPAVSVDAQWLVGPHGSGRTAVLHAAALRARHAGRQVMWIGLGTLAHLQERLEHAEAVSFSALSDPVGEAVARWRQLWLDVRGQAGAETLLLLDDVERFPAAARAALKSAELGPALIATDTEPETGATWLIPQASDAEVADLLSRASAGRAWDAALTQALAAGIGAERVQLWSAAAALVEEGAALVSGDRVNLAPDADPAAWVTRTLVRQRQLHLPAARAWPLWAELAVQPLHTVLSPQAAAAVAPEDAGLLRRDAQGMSLASLAVRSFLRSQLPGAVLAQAALQLGKHSHDAEARIVAYLDALAWGSTLVPPGHAVAPVLAARLARGDVSGTVALADAWLKRAPTDDPALAEVTALHLRALAWTNSDAVTSRIAQIPAHLQDDGYIQLALAEVAFRRGDYLACRLAAAQLAHDDASERRAAGQLWLAFAATWQGDRETAAQAVAAGARLATPETAPFFGYLAALGSYYSGDLAEASTRFEQLWRDPALHQGPLHAASASGLGLCAHRRGDLTQARHWYDLAREAAERAGDRLRAINMAMNVAILDHEQGDLGRALQGYDDVVEAARRAANPGALARALGNRGNLLSQLGHDARALADTEEALAACLAQKNHYLAGNALCVLAELARRAGNPELASRHLGQAESALELAAASVERLEIALERAELSAFSGQRVQALATARQVLDEARSLGSNELQARATVLLTRLQLAEGPADRGALEAVIEALRTAQAWVPAGKPLLLVALLAELARALAWLGDWPAAAQAARDGLARLDAIARSLTPADQPAFRHGVAHGATFRVLQLLARLPQAAHAVSAASPHALAPILAINRRMGAETELAPLLEIVMDSAVLLTGAERGFLILDHDGALNVMVARNLDRENLRKAALKVSWGIARQVFQSGERVLTTDALQDDRFRSQASVHAGSLRSILCVPMAWQGRVIGALYVDNRFTAGAFSAEHAALLEALADQAAIAVEHARVVTGERLAQERLRQSQQEVQQLAEQLAARLDQTEHALDDARAALIAQRLDVQRRSDYSQIRGESPALLRLFGLMDRVRDHDFPVLIVGESGTGKELVARAIHFTGRRKRGPFLAINCAALPSTLLESELFGHVRGAFTGAVQDRRGLFESADGGTLLLDEIGEMPLEMQAKLLRVLQTGELQRVGDTRTRKVDVRVVAATHRNLPEMAETAQFRQDLLFRLRVVELAIPPLRARLDDLPLLAEHFLAENRKAGIGEVERLTPAALRRLREFSWPGNVRQLETILKSAALFAHGDAIDVADVEPLLSRDRPAEAHAARADAWWQSAPLDEIIRRAVADRVEACAGNKRRAAETLDIDRTTLYARLRG